MRLAVTAFFPAFMHRGVVFLLTAARAGLFPAMGYGVDSRPGAALGLLGGRAAMFISFLNVLCLALLFACIGAFVSAGH
jgi:hypothetical protein